MEKIYYKAPFGNLEILGDDIGIYEINFTDKFINTKPKNENLKLCLDELDRYFKGLLVKFSVKLNLSGTKFEQKIYKTLLKIPYGKTLSYKEVAQISGHKNAFRAVGNANSKNKIKIIIPCHRVVSINGLGGYSGEIWIKEFLLNLEKTNHLKI